MTESKAISDEKIYELMRKTVQEKEVFEIAAIRNKNLAEIRSFNYIYSTFIVRTVQRVYEKIMSFILTGKPEGSVIVSDIRYDYIDIYMYAIKSYFPNSIIYQIKKYSSAHSDFNDGYYSHLTFKICDDDIIANKSCLVNSQYESYLSKIERNDCLVERWKYTAMRRLFE